MKPELITYINPLLSCLICTSFAVILFLIKGRKQIDESEEKGLNSFILAFLIFGIVGLIDCVSLSIKISETELSVLKIIKVILSTLNSILLISAISNININHSGISSFLKNKLLFVFLGIMASVIIIMTIYIGLTKKIENLWFADNIFSILSIFCLGIVMIQAFIERRMKHFTWIVMIMLVSILVTQLLKLEGFIPIPENLRVFLSTLFSIFYKTLFCLIILLLLFSYQIVQYNELLFKNRELNDSNIVLQDELLHLDDFIDENKDESVHDNNLKSIQNNNLHHTVTLLTDVELDVIRIMYKHPSKSSLTFISQKLNRPLPTIVSQIKNIKKKVGIKHKDDIIKLLEKDSPLLSLLKNE